MCYHHYCQKPEEDYTKNKEVKERKCKIFFVRTSISLPNRIGMTHEQLFLSWYDQYADKLFRYCLFRVYDREQAKELTQQVFLKTWEYLGKGNSVDTPQAFLYRIATNLIIDEKEKKQPISLDELVDNGTEPASTDEKRIMEMNIDARYIIERIDELDPLYKEVLMLRYVDDLGPKDIAHILGETQNVISVRLHRGKAQLKELLKKHKHTKPQTLTI